MMRTEMTSPLPNSGHGLKGGAAKAVRAESAGVGSEQAKSAGDEGDDVTSGFSALLLSLGEDAANPAEVSTNQPSLTEDVRATDIVCEGNVPEASLTMLLAAEAAAQPSPLTPAWDMGVALLAMPQSRAVGGASDPLNALTQGLSSMGPTLGKISRPLLGAALSTVSGDASGVTLSVASAAPDANRPAVLPEGASDGDAFVGTAGVAKPVNASGADLNPRDSKNPMNSAQGHGMDWRSDVSLMVDKPELIKLSATAQEGGGQKPLQKTPVMVDGGAWSAPSFQLADSRMAATPAPEVGANAAVATTLAQQVNYWIGRNVQSAELKFDGLGNSPVEVSISMQGREAHVEFRADQQQTRQIIEQAMPQLKALLQSEGLALGGVSIGSSGAEASFSQAKQSKQPPRQGTARVAELGLMEAVNRSRPAAGRALDLFV